MTRENAICYLQSSGFSEEQITAIEQAFNGEPCEDAIHNEREQAYMQGYEDAYKKGWHDAIGKALDEAYDIVIDGERFSVVQEETLMGLGMAYEQASTEKTGRLIYDRNAAQRWKVEE